MTNTDPSPLEEVSFEAIRDRHREIVSTLIHRLPTEAADSGRVAWTIAVKKIMQRLAVETEAYRDQPRLEFYGTLRGEEKSHKEWLIDVVWYYRDLGTESESILLALESEWQRTPSEVVNDFSKLLAVKAPIKIMLFECPADPSKYLESLTSLASKWTQHSQGDLIYLVNFARGKHKTWFYEVRKSGKIHDFGFECLKNLSDIV